jgi:hypothetical protein
VDQRTGLKTVVVETICSLCRKSKSCLAASSCLLTRVTRLINLAMESVWRFMHLEALKIKTIRSFDASGSTHSPKQHYVPDELLYRLFICSILFVFSSTPSFSL